MKSNIILSTGKEIYANRGLVSIAKNNKDDWNLCEGYDGDIWLTEYVEDKEDYQPVYTKEELVELAEIMMSRWQEFRFDVLNGDVPTKESK